MTSKPLLLVLAVMAITSISLVPVYAQNIGSQLTIQSGYQNTTLETIVCGTGVCFSMITADTNTGHLEFLFGTSGNECTLTSTFIQNATATQFHTAIPVNSLQSTTVLDFLVGDLIQLSNSYSDCT